MHFQLTVAPPTPTLPAMPALTVPTDTSVELLRQMLDVQREHLGLVQSQIANADSTHRWRVFLQRWSETYPHLAETCRLVLPTVERAYLHLIDEMVTHLADLGPDELCQDFTMGEFLDRFGTRLSQMGMILNQVGSLAETAN